MERNCSEKNCKLNIFHWHCDYCKEVQVGYWSSSRVNCKLCSGEKTAKTKLSRIRKAIKNEISKYKDKEESEIINILKSLTNELHAEAFHGSSEDKKMIIDNYFDKSKQLPPMSVNDHGPIDLNYSRQKNFFDNTNWVRKKIYINCSYYDKDECKSLGGEWDNDKKSWYIPKGIDSTKFKKWL
uniref:DUF5710 domain-containing protein n=1 Tax=Marseillevirus LCMAC102 TaxID=2506603 RepID=A0A481YTK1_9VIRU|nr:MAG: hypothetical protein LCMAC102_03530 [Marseillevirus LCMAC102]